MVILNLAPSFATVSKSSGERKQMAASPGRISRSRAGAHRKSKTRPAPLGRAGLRYRYQYPITFSAVRPTLLAMASASKSAGTVLAT